MQKIGSVESPAKIMNKSDAAQAEVSSSASYRGWVLLLMFLMMTFNYMDRSVLTILNQPIKVEFHLTDFELGIMGGPAFAILYMLLSVPIARLAERRSRVSIIAGSVVIWSVMTALCGIARTFGQLLVMRVGVGIGEAGAYPPSQSLISDYYPPRQRTSALGVQSFGIAMGGLAGSAIGGIVGETWGWRAALLTVGLPGLLLALLIKFTVTEPRRSAGEVLVESGDDPVATEALKPPSLTAAVRHMFTQATFVHIVIGAAIANFANQGLGQFNAVYFIRRFDVSLAKLGLLGGLAGGLATGLGMLAGGFLCDWLGRRDLRWYVWAPAIGLTLSVPLRLFGFSQTSWLAGLIILALPGLLIYIYHSSCMGLTQNLAGPQMRATAAALFTMVTATAGLAAGPIALGALSDWFGQRLFASHHLGSFTTACVKAAKSAGHAKAGLATSAAPLHQACQTASAEGLRDAMMLTSVLLIWSAIHFLLAARSIRRDLARSTSAA